MSNPAWSTDRLGNLAIVRARIGWKGLAAHEYTPNGPFLVAGKHIVSGRVQWDRCDHISGWRYRESEEIALRLGDVILSKDGTLGRTARIDSLPGEATINGTMMLIRATSRLYYRFLYQYLEGHQFQRLIADKMSGSSIPHIFQRDMVTLTIPVPPLEEQRKIAEILDSVDESIRSTERVITKLNKMLSGATLALISNDHLANYDSRLERMVSIASESPGSTAIGPFGSNLVANDYKDSGVPVVFVRDIRESGFQWVSNVYVSQSKAAELGAHVVQAGDVLATKMGLPPCIASVYPHDMPAGVITADVIRLRPNPNLVLAEWVAGYLNSEHGKSQVRAITGGVTRPKVTLRDFRGLFIRVPPLTEQRRICKILDEHRGNMFAAEMQLVKLQRVKQGLMEDLLTGHVRVSR